MYRNAAGLLLMCTFRFTLPGTTRGKSKKTIRPAMLFRDRKTGRLQWRSKWPEIRSIYGLFRLAQYPDKQPLLVFGEKKCEAAAKLLGEFFVVVSLAGGDGAIGKIDLDPLNDRQGSLAWPDHDKSAYDAVLTAARRIKGMQIVVPDPTWAPAYDIGDLIAEGWDAARLVEYIKNHLVSVEEFEKIAREEFPSKSPAPTIEAPKEKAKAARTEQTETKSRKAEAQLQKFEEASACAAAAEPKRSKIAATDPFRPLGFTNASGRNLYHYSSKLSDSIISLPASAHRKPDFFQLAPREWWEAKFPLLKKIENPKTGEVIEIAIPGAIDWERAQSETIVGCSGYGIFDPSRHVRGVGFWRDAGRVIFHKGDGIIDDGKTSKLAEFKTEFVYEQREIVKLEAAASDDEARVLLEICQHPAILWADSISGKLYAGFIAISRLAGALRWRSHTWLTGGDESGKTTLLERVAIPALGGDTGGLLHIIGGAQTTEAHIRQALGPDAKVCLQDEADPNTEMARLRLQAVIGYMRAANMSGQIGKGSADGHALNYPVRSMFGVAAISHPLDENADVRRFTIFSLTRPPETDEARKEWSELSKQIDEKITPEFGRKLTARIIRDAQVVLTNVDRYRVALTARIAPGMADQLAPLLAGARFLETSEAIEPVDAYEEVQGLDLSPFTRASRAESRDEVRFFEDLLSQKIRVSIEVTEKGLGGKSHTRTIMDDRGIGELIQYVRRCLPPRDNNQHDALKRIGIRVDNSGNLLIRTRHNEITKLLKGNKWANNYALALRRLRAQHGFPPGARESTRTARFADGVRGEATELPAAMLQKLFDEDEKGVSEKSF